MNAFTRTSVVTLAVLAGLAPTASVAAWQSSGTGVVSVSTLSLERGKTPTAQRSNGTVVLGWAASTLSDGLTQATTYDVVRHGESDVTVCAGVAVTECVDTSPVPGLVTYGVVPRIGTHWEGAESVTTEFQYDEFAPVTEVTTRTPEPNSAGWNREDVTVTLTASDPDPVAAGVREIHYTLDGAETVVTGATATFTVSPEQVTAIEFWAVDELGNTEEPKSTAAVKIDRTAPTTVAALSGTGGSNGWYTSDVLVTLTAEDTLSGVSATEYSTGGPTGPWSPYTAAGVPVTAEGSTTVHFRSTDVAGNAEAVRSQLVRIDRIAPVSSASRSGSTVTLSATDEGSGVDRIEYRIGSAGYVTYTGPFTISAGQTISFHAIDNAGLVETPDNTLTAPSDVTGPSITPSGPVEGGSYVTSNSGTNSWSRVCASGKVCATVSDPSGVASVSYSLVGTSGSNAGKCWNGSAFVEGQSCSVSMTGSGTSYAGADIDRRLMGASRWSLTISATDTAGNVSTVTVAFQTTA